MDVWEWVVIGFLSLMLLGALSYFATQYIEKKNFEEFTSLISHQPEITDYNATYTYSLITMTMISSQKVNYSVRNGQVIIFDGEVHENFLDRDHDCNASFDQSKNISLCDCNSKIINCSALEKPTFKEISGQAGSLSGNVHKFRDCFSGGKPGPFGYTDEFKVCFKNKELISYEFSYILPGGSPVGQRSKVSWKRII